MIDYSFDDLTVVIVSYNSYEVITECMEAFITNASSRIVIVDNASPDQSGQRLQERYPNVEVVQLEQNVGYGRAANYAFARASTNFVLLLNPDVRPDLAALETMLATMGNDSEIALLAPAVTHRHYTQQGLITTDYVCGAVMLFRLAEFRAVGGFDENIFLFSEESDLCLRLNKANKKIVMDSNILFHHLRNQSSGYNETLEVFKAWHRGWSRSYYYNKHGLAKGQKNPVRLLISYSLKLFFSPSHFKRLEYRAKLNGTLAFMRGLSACDKAGKPRGWPV